MITMTAKEVMNDLMNKNTGGYFYMDNCRLNYSSIYGWYCKDFINNKMNTYNITEIEAEDKIIKSFEA
jgi:hypothetical protein